MDKIITHVLITRYGCQNETINNHQHHPQVQDKPKDIHILSVVSLISIIERWVPDIEIVDDGWIWEIKEVNKVGVIDVDVCAKVIKC